MLSIWGLKKKNKRLMHRSLNLTLLSRQKKKHYRQRKTLFNWGTLTWLCKREERGRKQKY
jgi:hypothetical protein